MFDHASSSRRAKSWRPDPGLLSHHSRGFATTRWGADDDGFVVDAIRRTKDGFALDEYAQVPLSPQAVAALKRLQKIAPDEVAENDLAVFEAPDAFEVETWNANAHLPFVIDDYGFHEQGVSPEPAVHPAQGPTVEPLMHDPVPESTAAPAPQLTPDGKADAKASDNAEPAHHAKADDAEEMHDAEAMALAEDHTEISTEGSEDARSQNDLSHDQVLAAHAQHMASTDSAVLNTDAAQSTPDNQAPSLEAGAGEAEAEAEAEAGLNTSEADQAEVSELKVSELKVSETELGESEVGEVEVGEVEVSETVASEADDTEAQAAAIHDIEAKEQAQATADSQTQAPANGETQTQALAEVEAAEPVHAGIDPDVAAQREAEKFAEGLAQGVAQGERQAHEAMQQEVQAQCTVLANVAQELQALMQNATAFYEPMKRLALHLAEQIVRAELRTSTQAIEQLIQRCLDELDHPAQGLVVLELNPDDKARLQAQSPELIRGMRLEAVHNMAPGSVRLFANDAVVEDLVAHRLQALAQSMLIDVAAWQTHSALAKPEATTHDTESDDVHP